ncbi:hypothetical protein GH714_008858 [Hevea brasiliensis]|uniref:Alpha 1,4-glycosyltransferase domain-containing protein n=1 Tax=Hevea brasiliensis TaxID=3981 RepID=A0A6A6LQX1_HEVBR|nr:hypothetical protein GH714_008858 [Hevea brasiliensis]
MLKKAATKSFDSSSFLDYVDVERLGDDEDEEEIGVNVRGSKEVVRYGGIYLDSDIIVLNPFPALNNTVGLEDQLAGSSLNGAVMAFRKNSLFIMECLKEFYATYDDTQLRWNGADLLTRVARRFLKKEDNFITQLELSVQPSYIFFPIGSQDMERV